MNSPSFVYRELERDIDQPVFIYLVSLSSSLTMGRNALRATAHGRVRFGLEARSQPIVFFRLCHISSSRFVFVVVTNETWPK